MSGTKNDKGNLSSQGTPRLEGQRLLQLAVNDQPPWHVAFIYGCQQATVALSTLLIYPFLLAEFACAGSSTISLRVRLISTAFTASGVATLLQTTLGLRLSILNGPSMAFLPPLLAFSQLPSNECSPSMRNASIPEEEWMARVQTMTGSLLVASSLFIVMGATGLVGAVAKRVGPITTVPLLLLLTLSSLPSITEKLALHWISVVMLTTVIVFVVYLADMLIPIPVFSNGRPAVVRVRLFGQFPYLLSVVTVWVICLILTVTGAEPEGGEARLDKPEQMKALEQAPWFSVPYPGQFGSPRVDIGLTCGLLASVVSSIIENLGSYAMAARVSGQKPAPRSSVNRAIIVEGVGSMVAAILGIGAGVTTYSENVALIQITRVASRITMQIAGVLLIFLGLFSKGAAVLATIPDSVIGALLCMGMSIIAGVALSHLEMVDLRMTRNLSILGLSILLGMIVPMHIESHPISTGNVGMDSVLNMLLSIKMLVGGLIAVFLDNSVWGATREQRGFHEEKLPSHGDELDTFHDDGYAFPEIVNRFLRRHPWLSRLPFLPSLQMLNSTPPNHAISQSI